MNAFVPVLLVLLVVLLATLYVAYKRGFSKPPSMSAVALTKNPDKVRKNVDAIDICYEYCQEGVQGTAVAFYNPTTHICACVSNPPTTSSRTTTTRLFGGDSFRASPQSREAARPGTASPSDICWRDTYQASDE